MDTKITIWCDLENHVPTAYVEARIREIMTDLGIPHDLYSIHYPKCEETEDES